MVVDHVLIEGHYLGIYKALSKGLAESPNKPSRLRSGPKRRRWAFSKGTPIQFLTTLTNLSPFPFTSELTSSPQPTNIFAYFPQINHVYRGIDISTVIAITHSFARTLPLPDACTAAP